MFYVVRSTNHAASNHQSIFECVVKLRFKAAAFDIFKQKFSVRMSEKNLVVVGSEGEGIPDDVLKVVQQGKCRGFIIYLNNI